MGIIRQYILFPNVNSGLALEAHLKKEKIKYTIVPTPRQLSECCGICIMYEKQDEDKIKLIIEENSLSITGFREMEIENRNYYTDHKA